MKYSFSLIFSKLSRQPNRKTWKKKNCYQNTQIFSTNLTLSYELHTELNANKCNKEEEAMIPDDDSTQNLLQTLENQNSQTLSCEFCTKQEQKVVLTALTLFDKSWVSPVFTPSLLVASPINDIVTETCTAFVIGPFLERVAHNLDLELPVREVTIVESEREISICRSRYTTIGELQFHSRSLSRISFCLVTKKI